MEKAIVMRLEGVYTRSHSGRSLPPVPSPSTIAGAFIQPLLAYYSKYYREANNVKDLRPIIEHSLHSAYVAFDRDTELTTTTLLDTKSGKKTEVTFVKNLYALLLLNNTSLTDIELRTLATTIQSIGGNDSGLQVKEAFVVQPVKVHTNYVNTYVPQLPESIYSHSEISAPFTIWKLKENVALRTDISNGSGKILLRRYLVPVKSVRVSQVTMKYVPNFPEGGKIPLSEAIETVEVGDFIVPTMKNIRVE